MIILKFLKNVTKFHKNAKLYVYAGINTINFISSLKKLSV